MSRSSFGGLRTNAGQDGWCVAALRRSVKRPNRTPGREEALEGYDAVQPLEHAHIAGADMAPTVLLLCW